jgi:ribosomal protein S18 acetylase RimI-like enzyme
MAAESSEDTFLDRVAVREVRLEDLDSSVRHLWMRLAEEMFEVEPLTVPSEANSCKWLDFVKEGLVKRRNVLLAAKVEEKTVGYALLTLPREQTFEVQESFGIVNELYVLPEFRRKGIGKKLLEQCLNRVKAEGFKTARISVISGDKDAIRLYKKLGFRVFMYNMTKRLF